MDVREHLEQLAGALGAPLRVASDDPASLDEAGRELTEWWRERARAASRRLFRSPLYREPKPLPGGREALYTYERSLWPVPLERAVPAPPGWEAESVVCRSLPAAWATLLVSLRDLQEQPVTVRCWRPRAHVRALLDCLAPGRWSEARGADTLESSLRAGRAHLYVIEAADFEPLPPAGGVLALDVTERPDFPLERVLAGPWLVAVLERWDAHRSFGLELEPVGEIRLYAPRSLAEPLTPLATASELARRVRSVVGGCPSYAQLWEWCLPTLEDRSAFSSRLLPLPPDLEGWQAAAARRGIREGNQGGAVGHRYEVTPDGLLVRFGRLPPELLDDLPAGPPRRSERSRAPRWPQEPIYRGDESSWLEGLGSWRRQTLEVADRAEARLEELEERLHAYEPVDATLLFSSAMAALAALSLLMPRLSSEARYFETKFLHEVLHNRGEDVHWLESVQYDWELTPARPGRRDVLVLDTTLTGNRVKLQDFEFRLGARVFSVLKLDQRGQELENGGAVLLKGPPELVGPIRQALERLRASLGAEPNVRRLSPPWTLRPDDPHAGSVFANNAWLARHLKPGGLLRRIVHPATSVAPFCVLHLADPSMDCHRYLSALIEKLKRDAPFERGASFGFVGHRHEFIVPVLKDDRALFKVAMGSSPGPSRQRVLEVLQEALDYPDLRALRQAHPGLEPVAPAADWSAPSPRMVRYLAGSSESPVQP